MDNNTPSVTTNLVLGKSVADRVKLKSAVLASQEEKRAAAPSLDL